MHKVQQILNVFSEKLQPVLQSGLVKEILKNRASAPNFSPAIAIKMGEDIPNQDNATFLDSDLQVYTDIYVISTESDLDKSTLEIRTEIQKAIMSEFNLGLDFVLVVSSLGQLEPDYDGNGEQYAGATRVVWGVKYRSSISDPSL